MSRPSFDRFLSTTSRVVLVAAGLGLLSLALFYPVCGDDGWIHLNWLSQFPALVSNGTLYPRWMPDSFVGFGSPAFYFYPPLVYWVGSIVYFVGVHSALALYQSLTVVFTILSGGTCYWYLFRLRADRNAAAIGALVYCVFPYRFADMYLRNALTEHAAFAFIPIVLLSLSYVHSLQKPRFAVIAFVSAVGWTGLLITNLPVTVIMIYVSLVYAISCRFYRAEYRRGLAALASGGALAVVISAAYLLPISRLMDAASMNMLFIDTSQGGNFVTTGYALVDVFFKQKVNTLHILLCAVIAIGVWVLVSNRKTIFAGKAFEGRHDRAIGWVLGVALFLQIPYLIPPLWHLLPLMKIVQFNWRWDMLVALATAVFVSLNLTSRASSLLVLAVSVLTIAVAVKYYSGVMPNPTGFNPGGKFAVDAPEYIPSSVALPPDSEYALVIKHRSDAEVQTSAGIASSRAVVRESFSTAFEANVASAGATLVFHRMYFPTWHLRDDRGVEYPVRSDSIGRIVSTLPQGKRNYLLKIIPTNNERIGAWISAVGILLLLSLGLFIRFSRRRASLPS